jgi:hypothetical protein
MFPSQPEDRRLVREVDHLEGNLERSQREPANPAPTARRAGRVKLLKYSELPELATRIVYDSNLFECN